ncbi:MAG TPA: FAD binding domain-containing protein [Pseudomonadales bacterium]|nr:FAD binding domain-containing protein [Pseudomonadales bacterium]
MRFALNDQYIECESGAPDRTILELLRADLGQCGTKEGCASGDCGACTVLVSSAPVLGPAANAESAQNAYVTVNACIAPAATLEGHHLITVEGLARDGVLHPAQQAMVDEHGSQCGFCTPGFVVSLAGLLDRHTGTGTLPRETILESISGNLCRCTGYRPIIAAAERMLQQPGRHALADLLASPATPLPARADEPDAGGDFHRPTTEAALQQLLREHPRARLIAGGTDLMLEHTQLYRDLGPLIDVRGIAELCGVSTDGDVWRIGAAEPLTAVQAFFATELPALEALLARYGSPQIRNRGTLGGNFGTGSPIGDLPPVMQALGAELVIGSAAGTRRTLAAEDFHLDYRKTALAPGEYLVEARAPRPAADDLVRIRKFSKRFEDDISSVLGAACVRRDAHADAVRLAFGGVAAVPVRARAVEALLNGGGQPADMADDALRAALAEDIRPIDDVRASAAYRFEMAFVFARDLRDALQAAPTEVSA